MKRRRISAATLVAELVLVGLGLASLFPIAYMVVTALKTRDEFIDNRWGLPASPTLQNFSDLFGNGQVVRWLLNSVEVTVSGAILVVLVSLFASFAIARLRFRGRALIQVALIVLIAVPPVIVIVPLFVLFSQIGFIDTIPGVVLIDVGVIAPFGTYLLVGFMRSVSLEVIEAALVDGASSLQILRFVVAPLVAPALATVAVIASLTIWNELLVALVFLPSDDNKTLMAALTLFESRATTNEPLIMAGTFVATLPMIVVYVLGFRFFERGLMGGAIK
jgi:ABC-type glycerol-3-phosphate transport system permease component